MHHPFRRITVTMLCLLAVAVSVPRAVAGVQDFTLVNQTGIEIYSLYLSESSTDEWEEDVLGEDVLPSGERLDITFSGGDSCLWDMMVTDDEGSNVTWTGINLCETSVVVLRCNDQECWFESE